MYILEKNAEGMVWRADCPVLLITHAHATRFCEWKAATSGLPWRLPSSCEWEKAARGVDARSYSMGEWPDPHWTNMQQSAHPPRLAPIYAYEADCSVYGVRGMTGNVRDWTSSTYAEDMALLEGQRSIGECNPRPDALYVVRGGSWNSRAAFCRAAGRFANRPEQRFRNVGFRMVRTVQQ